jgi:glycosyltransferase involved in cell wall biosynthesis
MTSTPAHLQALRWLGQLDRPWLAHLITKLRPDLCELYGLERGSPRGGVRFLQWLLRNGVAEYRGLREDSEFLAFLQRRHPGTGLTVIQLLTYSERPDVQSAFPLHKDGSRIATWFEQHGVHEHDLEPLLSRGTAQPVSHDPKLPFGVNLIGYAFGQLGIGEDLRMAARALQTAGVPFAVVNFPPGEDVAQGDRSVADLVGENAPYAVNLFCMSALEQGRFYVTRGRKLVDGRYNIGYWPWELSRWPDEWKDLTRLVDEVWVSSTHTFDALASVSSVPVLLMPMSVDLETLPARSRRQFGLHETARLFCFSLDLNSSIHRKNPQACLNAFLQAFPKRSRPDRKAEVGLVIKAHAPRRRNLGWNRLKEIAARDSRIHIVEGTLPRPELLALYKCCDCFVSLHRAEGFGRNIAEALLLGLHVIATGYSGNMDFCNPPHTDLVRYQLVKVRKGQYPFGTGQVWAEPDVAHAAELMRAFATAPKRRRRPSLDKSYSPRSVGENYRLRLTQIAGKR